MPYLCTLPASRMALALAACLLPLWATAQTSAARVMAVVGLVKVVDAQGRERALEKGAEIKSGDKIVTAEGALAQIRLNDGGYMSIRPGTEMVIDRFHYDERKPAESSLLISLLRGGMRSISGLIGKSNPDGYQIKSNTATVGIRGTDHEPMVIPPNVPELARLGAPGLYDKVNEGETFIRNQAGVLSIKRGEVGFTAANLPTAIPQMLKVLPEFYRVELKVDARDPKDAASIDTQGRREPAPAVGGLLRPTTAARREALNQAGSLQPVTTEGVILDKTLSTTPLQPAATSRLLSPAATTTLTTTELQPLTTSTSTLNATTTLVAPVSSSLSTGAVLQPLVTTVSPATTLVAPISSTLMTVSPTISSSLSTTTVLQPLITTVSPAATLVAPISSTLTTVSPAISSSLSTTTISPAVSATTVISPTLSTTTIKTLK